MARDYRELAARAGGKPAQLKLAVSAGDGDTTLNVSGVELGDLVGGSVEFYSPDEATNTAIAGVRGGSVTAAGVITVSEAGSAIPSDHSTLVLYYDFD